MIILRRGKITYYVKNESVIVGINDFQFIAYTVYLLQNRRPFYDFRRAILDSADDEYATPIDHILLSQRFGLRAVPANKPRGV